MKALILILFSLEISAQDFGSLDFKKTNNNLPTPIMEKETQKSVNLFGGYQLMPDSYGITIYQGQREYSFRSVKDAQKFLSKMPEYSATLAIFYGHGAPGIMTLGQEGITSSEIKNMLEGKMALNSAVHLFGCNTASVPNEISLNPLKGLSYLARRIVYYQGARVSGASKETAEEMWNEDMALDLSKNLKDIEVCGLSTYGLVPERLIGKENTKPGFVLGEWTCYKNASKTQSSSKK